MYLKKIDRTSGLIILAVSLLPTSAYSDFGNISALQYVAAVHMNPPVSSGGARQTAIEGESALAPQPSNLLVLNQTALPIDGTNPASAEVEAETRAPLSPSEPAADAPQSADNSATAQLWPAETPFFRHVDARAAMYSIGITLLVVTVVGGGILMVTYGLMSKRSEDLVGERTPSDVGLLKESMWPNEAGSRAVLPALDPGQQPSQTSVNVLTNEVPVEKLRVGTTEERSILSGGDSLADQRRARGKRRKDQASAS